MSDTDLEATRSILASSADLAQGVALRILDTLEADDPDNARWSKLKAADEVLQVADRYRARADAIAFRVEHPV